MVESERVYASELSQGRVLSRSTTKSFKKTCLSSASSMSWLTRHVCLTFSLWAIMDWIWSSYNSRAMIMLRVKTMQDAEHNTAEWWWAATFHLTTQKIHSRMKYTVCRGGKSFKDMSFDSWYLNYDVGCKSIEACIACYSLLWSVFFAQIEVYVYSL